MEEQNNFIGEWKYSEPNGVVIPELSYELKSIVLDWEKLQIIYDDMNGIQVEITFDIDTVLTYRWADESDRWRTVSQLLYELKKTNKENRIILELKNSEFETWFQKETFNKYSGWNVRHFILSSNNDVVDVLTMKEPKVIVRTEKTDLE